MWALRSFFCFLVTIGHLKAANVEPQPWHNLDEVEPWGLGMEPRAGFDIDSSYLHITWCGSETLEVEQLNGGEVLLLAPVPRRGAKSCEFTLKASETTNFTFQCLPDMIITKSDKFWLNGEMIPKEMTKQENSIIADELTVKFTYKKWRKLRHFACSISTATTETPIEPPTEAPKETTKKPEATTTEPASCRCGKANSLGARIVNGEDATKHEYPWQVGLAIQDNFMCGGSIVSPRHVITAAHCVDYENQPELYTVAVGAHKIKSNWGNIRKVKIASMKNHPKWNPQTIDYDICVIELAEELSFDETMSPVCLPPQNGGEYAGKMATISGWGRTIGAVAQGADTLQKAEFKVWEAARCQSHWNIYTSRMLCAGGNTDTMVSGCMGDSGGPMTYKDPKGHYELIGVTSFGPKTCAASDGPSTYARMNDAEIYSFVKAQTQGTEVCE